MTISHETHRPNSCSIIIPAYNEERRIKDVILRYLDEFPGQEFIIVCDGKDNTSNIIKYLSSYYSNLRLLSFDERLGKGRAIIEGFKVANGELIGFVDADESVNPNDIKRMFNAIKDFDGIIASRRLKESKILVKQPLKRRIASKTFNLIVRSLFGLPFKDTQCGAKFFRRNAILDIIDDLETSGFEIDVEILWRLKNEGYNVLEYPITWKHSEGSVLKLSNSWDMLVSLLKIRFK